MINNFGERLSSARKIQTIDFIQKYLEVEEILNEASVFENPVTRNLFKAMRTLSAHPSKSGKNGTWARVLFLI